MPLNPPPTIQAALALVTTALTHSASPRQALITYAVLNDVPLSVQNLANMLQTEFVNNLQPGFDVEVTIGPTSVTLGDGTNVPQVAISNNSNVPGLRPINSLPPNNNFLVKKQTGFAGRKNRGRNFFPWSCDEANVSEVGIAVPAEVNAQQTRVDNWRISLTAALLPLVIANRQFSSPVPPRHVTAITGTKFVQSMVVESLVGSQRRRLGR
jgi:hypothetical protein